MSCTGWTGQIKHPLLAGPPVEFAGRRFYDAGVSESVPYRTALAQGATHILVLRSRRDPLTWPDRRTPSRSVRLIARTTLRRETLALRATFLSRDARPAPDSPEVSRLATNGKLLRAAFESGRAATRAALQPP